MNMTRLLPPKGSNSVTGGVKPKANGLSEKKAETKVLWKLKDRNGLLLPKETWIDKQRTPLLWFVIVKVFLFVFYFYGEGRSKPSISGSLFYHPLTNKFSLAILFWKHGRWHHSFCLEHTQPIEPEFQDFDILLQIIRSQPSPISVALHVTYEMHIVY